MKITFHDFDLEPPYTAGCLSDYIDLDIYDLRDRMTFHRRFCGGSLPGPLLVLHPKAKIVFRSNHAVHHRGFFATYEFVDEGSRLNYTVIKTWNHYVLLKTGNQCCFIFYLKGMWCHPRGMGPSNIVGNSSVRGEGESFISPVSRSNVKFLWFKKTECK